MNRIPYRVSRHPPTVRPVGRTDFPEVLGTLQRHPRASPCVGRVVQPRPGSAPRLSQPLSGFRKLEFHGLVSCRSQFLGCHSFRAFPSQRSCAPLEATDSLAVIHHPADHATRRTVRPPFPRRPRRWRRCLVPRRTMAPLSTRRSALPGRPEPHTLRSPSGRFTHLGALLPLRIRSRRTRLPEPTADALHGRPSRDQPQTLGPRPIPRLTPKGSTRAPTPPEGAARDPGDLSTPGARWDLTASPKGDDPIPSAASDPLRGRSAPPLGDVPTLSTLELWPRPQPLAHRASKYLRADDSPQRSACLA
jgi:hypothetical protein